MVWCPIFEMKAEMDIVVGVHRYLPGANQNCRDLNDTLATLVLA